MGKLLNTKVYKGETLKDCIITYKIDGVRLHVTDGNYTSRSGKPLYNLPSGIEDGIYEIFDTDWKSSITRCRTHDGKLIEEDRLYRIAPSYDSRLIVHENISVDSNAVNNLLKDAKLKGYEGLVILSKGIYYKVKTTETYDVEVLDILPGTGKHTGRMGALITSMGKVGTGFTDADRELNDWLGSIIEVECMELTEAGKFRHPRYIRRRTDKE